MNSCTGIVMETNKKSAILMTNNGEFLKVNTKGIAPSLGEVYTGELPKTLPFYKQALTAASLAFILLFGSSAYAYYTPVASLKVDINPSISLDVNRWNKIIKYTPLNSDGEKVLSEINIKNKAVNEGLNIIIDEAKKDNFINDNYKESGKIISIAIESKGKGKKIDLSEFEAYIKKENLKVNIYNSNKPTPSKALDKKDINKPELDNNKKPTDTNDSILKPANPTKNEGNDDKNNSNKQNNNSNSSNHNNNGNSKNGDNNNRGNGKHAFKYGKVNPQSSISNNELKAKNESIQADNKDEKQKNISDEQENQD